MIELDVRTGELKTLPDKIAPAIEHDDDIFSPTELREQVYNTQLCIEWDGAMLTVTEAAQQWMYYAAEGRTDKTDKLTELIAEAKQTIRTQWPD